MDSEVSRFFNDYAGPGPGVVVPCPRCFLRPFRDGAGDGACSDGYDLCGNLLVVREFDGTPVVRELDGTPVAYKLNGTPVVHELDGTPFAHKLDGTPGVHELDSTLVAAPYPAGPDHPQPWVPPPGPSPLLPGTGHHHHEDPYTAAPNPPYPTDPLPTILDTSQHHCLDPRTRSGQPDDPWPAPLSTPTRTRRTAPRARHGVDLPAWRGPVPQWHETPPTPPLSVSLWGGIAASESGRGTGVANPGGLCVPAVDGRGRLLVRRQTAD